MIRIRSGNLLPAIALALVFTTGARGTEPNRDRGAAAGQSHQRAKSLSADRDDARRARMKMIMLDRAHREAIQGGDVDRRRELEAMIAAARVERKRGARSTAVRSDPSPPKQGRSLSSPSRRHGARRSAPAAGSARTIRVTLPSNCRARTDGATGSGKSCKGAPAGTSRFTSSRRTVGKKPGKSRAGRLNNHKTKKKNLFTTQAKSVSPKVKPPGR